MPVCLALFGRPSGLPRTPASTHYAPAKVNHYGLPSSPDRISSHGISRLNNFENNQTLFRLPHSSTSPRSSMSTRKSSDTRSRSHTASSARTHITTPSTSTSHSYSLRTSTSTERERQKEYTASDAHMEAFKGLSKSKSNRNLSGDCHEPSRPRPPLSVLIPAGLQYSRSTSDLTGAISASERGRVQMPFDNTTPRTSHVIPVAPPAHTQAPSSGWKTLARKASGKFLRRSFSSHNSLHELAISQPVPQFPLDMPLYHSPYAETRPLNLKKSTASLKSNSDNHRPKTWSEHPQSSPSSSSHLQQTTKKKSTKSSKGKQRLDQVEITPFQIDFAMVDEPLEITQQSCTFERDPSTGGSDHESGSPSLGSRTEGIMPKFVRTPQHYSVSPRREKVRTPSYQQSSPRRLTRRPAELSASLSASIPGNDSSELPMETSTDTIECSQQSLPRPESETDTSGPRVKFPSLFGFVRPQIFEEDRHLGSNASAAAVAPTKGSSLCDDVDMLADYILPPKRSESLHRPLVEVQKGKAMDAKARQMAFEDLLMSDQTIRL